MSSGISAAPEVQRRLLDLQALDDELTRVAAHRKRLDSGTELAGAETEHRLLRRAGAEHRGVLEDLRTRIRRVESDVALVEQRLERDRSRLQTTSSPKDATGLEQEMVSLGRRRGALEDDQLELMEAAESAQAEARVTADALAEVEERLERMRTDRDDALAGLTGQRAEAETRRAALAAEVPADLLALYDRQRTRYGVGAARLVGAVSQGSNMALTGADLARVRSAAADAVVLDPESNCILIRD